LEKLVQKILNKIYCSYEDVKTQECKARAGMLEGSVSIVINLLLFVIKLVPGIIFRSVSLIADAFHTLSDVLTSLVIFVSFKVSSKEADDTHPFGHGRMESVATLIVAVLMIVAGVELFKSSFKRILHPVPVNAPVYVIVAVFLTVVVKEGLAQFSRILARAVGSLALEADFWHHRIDAISSILVVIALAGQRFGLIWLDGAVGILVALLVAYTGWDIARKGVDEILGTKPNSVFVKKIKEFIKKFPDVYDVHDMVVHQYGSKVILSFHIEVPDSLSFRQAHNLSDNVEKAVNREFNTYCTVHVDPVNFDNNELKAYRYALAEIINLKYREDVSVHDIRIVEDGIVKNLLFDVQFSSKINAKGMKTIIKFIKAEMFSRFPELDNIITEIEPIYAV